MRVLSTVLGKVLTTAEFCQRIVDKLIGLSTVLGKVLTDC